MQICRCCKKQKFEYEFHKDSYRETGISIYCKDCRNIIINHNTKIKRRRKKLIKQLDYYRSLKWESYKRIQEIVNELIDMDKKMLFNG